MKDLNLPAKKRMQQNEKTLAEFKAAWVKKDISKMMSLITDDIIYSASIGPEPGQTWHGRKQVKAGIESMLAHDDGAEVIEGEIWFFKDKAFSQWIYQKPQSREIGCDLFTFRDGLIAIKDAYRKCREVK